MDANIFSKLPGVLYEFFQYFQCLHGTRYARQSIIVLWFALYYGYVRQLPCLNTSHHFFIKCCGIFSLLFVPFSACYLYHFQLVICTALLCFGEEILRPTWRDMFSYFDNIYRDDLIFLSLFYVCYLFVDVPVFIYMFISISVFLVFPFTVFCFFDL